MEYLYLLSKMVDVLLSTYSIVLKNIDDTPFIVSGTMCVKHVSIFSEAERFYGSTVNA